MNSNIEELITALYDLIQDAKTLPLGADKCIVERDRVLDMLDEISAQMPGEIKQAKAIVNDRRDIVETAKREADGIIKKAEDRARALVEQEEIVKAAQQRAAEMLTAAQGQAREMRTTVTEYCENMLRQTEETLARSAAEVKNVRQTLRQNAKAGTAKK